MKKIKRTLIIKKTSFLAFLSKKQYCKKMKVHTEITGRDKDNELVWHYRGSFHTWKADFFTTLGYKTEEEAQVAINRGTEERNYEK